VLYGESKRRQMARSILPSTSRREARKDLGRLRRRSRRRSHQELGSLTVCADVPEVLRAWEDAGFDPRRWDQRSIKEVVWERRLWDKVAPFLRWAEAITAHLPAADRIDAMRAILPANLVGWHAVSHLQQLEHFSGHLDHLNIRYRPAPHPEAPGRAELHRELRRVVAAGEMGAFNRHMKRFPCGPDGEHWHTNPCRTLAGAHDLDALLSDCYLHRRREADRAAWVWSRPPRPWLAGLHAWYELHAPRDR